jgi:hypothetical protein
MKKQAIISTIILLFGILLLVNFVSSEMLVSDAGVQYDSEIISAFNTSEWVGIFFKLNNMSEADNLIFSFSNSEFQLIRKSSTRIVGEITKEGFEKLISNLNVKSVYYNAPSQIAEENRTIDNILNINKINYSIIFCLAGVVFLLFIIYLLIKKKKR